MTLTSATFKTLDDTTITVKIGDWVGFKSDYEQSGQIVKIERSQWGNTYELTLRNEEGFEGEYLRYAKQTVVRSDDCWVD